MTKYRCQKGCKNAEGRPEYHYSTNECAFEPNFDPQAKPNRIAAKTGVVPPVAKAAPAASSAPAATPAPVEPKGSPGTLTVTGGGVANVVDRSPTGQAQINPNWMLDFDTNETFWRTAYSVVHKIVRFIDRVIFELPEKDCVDPSVFAISPADLELMKGAPRRLATGILRSAGNETLEQAQDMVNGFGAIAFIGGTIAGIGEHLIHAYKVSPAEWAVKRREDAARQAEAAHAREVAALTANRDAQMGAATA